MIISVVTVSFLAVFALAIVVPLTAVIAAVAVVIAVMDIVIPVCNPSRIRKLYHGSNYFIIRSRCRRLHCPIIIVNINLDVDVDLVVNVLVIIIALVDSVAIEVLVVDQLLDFAVIVVTVTVIVTI